MYVLFDIGGTKTRIAVSKDKISISEPRIIDTPQNFDMAMLEIQQLVSQMSSGEKILEAVAGIAGSLSADKQMLMHSPHLPAWVGKKVKTGIEGILGCELKLENDATLCGLGEAVYGAGRGTKIVVYVTVSTGVGGVRIVNGHFEDSAYGFEPGHQLVEGQILENLISGTALEKKYGKKPFEIKDPLIWDDLAKKLAIGLYNATMFWSPELIVIGGSMMKEVGISIDKVSEYYRALPTPFTNMPKLKKGELGDKCGLYGALAMLKNEK